MTDISDTDNKPCSVKARQGFSVYYRNRYLYSQYDAEKPVTRLIDSLTILPETLILAYSPVLGTGLLQLLKQIPQGCFVLAVEFDPELFDFFMATYTAKEALTDPRFKAILLDRPEHIAELLSVHRTQTALSSAPDKASSAFRATGPALPPQGSFRRCLTVEMSGGTAFFQDNYRLTTKYADDAIATFWKNRITLTRMGRLYAKNLFENTKRIICPSLSGKTTALIPHSVSKTILVLGAGPSLDELLPALPALRDSFFILAADAALPALSQHDMLPDAVVAVESQLAIEKAYIGFAGSGIPLIADLTSRPRVLSIMNGPFSFFMTEYCNEPFIKRFTQLAKDNDIPVFPPLGSVGLYALEIALYLRTPETPVYFSGLDFAWGKGSTHCKGAPAHTNTLLNASRLTPAGNPAAAFGAGTTAFTGKNGETQYTTPNLSIYGHVLAERYKHTAHLFDIGNSGMETGLQRTSIESMLLSVENNPLNAKKRAYSGQTVPNNDIPFWITGAPVSGLISRRNSEEADGAAEKADGASSENAAKKAAVNACPFLDEEYNAVKEISALIEKYLADGTAADLSAEKADGFSETTKRLHARLEEHSYLFLHFPDAARGPSLTRDFLVRVKAEVVRLLTYLAGC